MRVCGSLLLVFLVAALFSPPAEANAPAAEPSCAAGPAKVGRTIVGTPCSDTIVASPGVAVVRGGGGNDTIVPAQLTTSLACPEGCHLGVGSQTFEGGEGDDVVYGERGNDTLKGGPGNDQLFGGIGDDLLLGGPGNDRLIGGFGADSIDGEGGDDYVRGDGTIDRIFDTGGGNDTLSYSTGITPGFGGTVPFANFPPAGGERGLRLKLGEGGENANNGVAPFGGGVDEVEGENFETIVGTPFSDYIVGTAEDQTFYGGGGADAIEGGGGSDALTGGADGDYLDGGEVVPRDPGKVSVGFMTPPGATPYSQLYLVGSSGNDGIAASYEAGSPSRVGFRLTGTSFDTSASDAGGCELKSATEADCPLPSPLDSLLLAGMAGTDTIAAEGFPASASVVAIGGEGNDSLTGGGTEDVLVDGPGEGADTLSALGGDDALLHNGGPDQLLGGDGNDLFLSNSICDGETLSGGNGRDNASWARFTESGVEANLETGVVGRPTSGPAPDCSAEALDSVSSIEDLEGSNGADALYGDGGPNQLLGHLGADTYFAGGGEDSILANSGDSDPIIDCGAGSDSALVDHPEFGDATPVECETVAEGDPNDFRTVTQLLPPPPPEPETTEPAKPPPPRRDTRPPWTSLLRRPPATLVGRRAPRTVSIRFGSDEAGSRFRCKLDRRPYRNCTSPLSYRVGFGAHAVRIDAIDAAGNADPTPALIRFRVVRR
jgi:Ca2+-binding RTX toxin-like protein